MIGKYCYAVIVQLLWSGLVATTGAVEQTLVLQQGNASYAGVRDTWVSSEDWAIPQQFSINYGLNGMLRLSRDGGDNPLLRFDLGAIPPNSLVTSASLALYNTTQSSDSDVDYERRIGLHEVLM